jgi:hypothetical protein
VDDRARLSPSARRRRSSLTLPSDAVRRFDCVSAALGVSAWATLKAPKTPAAVNTTGHHVMPCCVHWPAALRRIRTPASHLGVAVTVITTTLRRPHDAVGTRLAVCVRLCSCVRIPSKGICVGVPPAQFQLSARLPRDRSPYGRHTTRYISRSLGTALSLSTRSCRQTTLRWSGCRSLIPPLCSLSRQPSPFPARAPFAL